MKWNCRWRMSRTFEEYEKRKIFKLGDGSQSGCVLGCKLLDVSYFNLKNEGQPKFV